jgi:hypothetical protein
VIALQAYQWWEIILAVQIIGWPLVIIAIYCIIFWGDL